MQKHLRVKIVISEEKMQIGRGKATFCSFFVTNLTLLCDSYLIMYMIFN